MAELNTRPGAVPGADSVAPAKTYAVHALHRTPGQAAADLRAAAALGPDADAANGGLPRLGAALAVGDISREHAGVAVSAMNRLPRKLLREPLTDERLAGFGITPQENEAADRPLRCLGDVVDQLVTQHSLGYDCGSVDKLAKYMLEAADPDGTRSFDPDAVTRRGLRMTTDRTGMMLIRGELDPATAALFQAAIDAYSAPSPARTEIAEDGTEVQVRDDRSATMRRADALGTICRLALDHDPNSTQGGERTKIVIIVDAPTLAHARATDPTTPDPTEWPGPAEHSGTADQPGPVEKDGPVDEQSPGEEQGSAEGAAMAVDQPDPMLADEPDPRHPARPVGRSLPSPFAEFATGGLVDPRFLAQFSCDATLQAAILAPSGAILDLVRNTRTITPTQRRALVARDRGCVVPGCPAPPAWCDGHHVRWWRNGGNTDIGNLALLCGRHHTAVHQGIWTIQMRDGVPWVIPPDWVDKKRRPLRNTYRQDTATMHRLGTQLRLDLEQRPEQDKPPEQNKPPGRQKPPD